MPCWIQPAKTRQRGSGAIGRGPRGLVEEDQNNDTGKKEDQEEPGIQDENVLEGVANWDIKFQEADLAEIEETRRKTVRD